MLSETFGKVNLGSALPFISGTQSTAQPRESSEDLLVKARKTASHVSEASSFRIYSAQKILLRTWKIPPDIRCLQKVATSVVLQEQICYAQQAVEHSSSKMHVLVSILPSGSMPLVPHFGFGVTYLRPRFSTLPLPHFIDHLYSQRILPSFPPIISSQSPGLSTLLLHQKLNFHHRLHIEMSQYAILANRLSDIRKSRRCRKDPIHLLLVSAMSHPRRSPWPRGA